MVTTRHELESVLNMDSDVHEFVLAPGAYSGSGFLRIMRSCTIRAHQAGTVIFDGMGYGGIAFIADASAPLSPPSPLLPSPPPGLPTPSHPYLEDEGSGVFDGTVEGGCDQSCNCYAIPTSPNYQGTFGTSIQPFITTPGSVIGEGCHNFGSRLLLDVIFAD